MERRSRLSGWEVDTIIGKGHRQALLSLTERKSCFTLIAKLPGKHTDGVKRAMLRLLLPHAKRVHTLTADNGKEFAQHAEIARALRAKFYFAHLCASWERGSNENCNGLIRQYFPKQQDFTTITRGRFKTRWTN